MLFNKNLKILILLLSFAGSNAYGLEKGDWIIRGGVTNIDPQSDTGGVVTVDDKSNLTSTIVYFPTNNIGIEVEEKHLEVNFMKDCSEAFLTGTAVEITPINSVDDYKFSDRDVTKLLIKEFEDYVIKS